MLPVAGVFVGGRASRMGGIAKGLLLAPDGEPIVARTRRILEASGVSPVLVGVHPAYAELGLAMLEDDPGAAGPLAGILALLAHAGDRPAIAVACDMPLLSRDLVGRLLDAPADAPIVAPRRRVGARFVWEPFFARYAPPTVLPMARAFAREGGSKLQLLFDRVGARALALSREEEELLVDWDAPDDLPPGIGRGTRGT